MKRNNPETKPFLSWCLIVRNCEEKLPGALERCLRSIRERTPDAEIVIVDTMSSDEGLDLYFDTDEHARTFLASCHDDSKAPSMWKLGLTARSSIISSMAISAGFVEAPFGATWAIRVAKDFNNAVMIAGSPDPLSHFPDTVGLVGVRIGYGTVEIAKRYADVFAEYRGPRGDWTREMLAFDDAAAARNFSFSLAHGDWVAWIDADDELPGPEEVERLLKLNGRWKAPVIPEVKGGPLADVTRAVISTLTETEKAVLAQRFAPKPASLEEIIRQTVEANPEVDCFWAPYLFRKDENGLGSDWLDRERIVKNTGAYVWRSAGHEILVPANPAHPGKRAYLGTLLFVHNKRWNAQDVDFSVRRHCKVLLDLYERGEDRSTRTCLYLVSFSAALGLGREDEFIEAAFEASTNTLDRYRTYIAAAHRAAERGFTLDAYEHILTATALAPELPDAFVAGAEIAQGVEDWFRAADWFEAASKCQPGQTNSQVAPRRVAFEVRAEGAYCSFRAGEFLESQMGDLPGALAQFERAARLVEGLKAAEGIGPDALEASCLRAQFENRRQALRAALMVREVRDWLVRNDETERAEKAKELLPYHYRHHPAFSALEQADERVHQHLMSPDEYRCFYEDDAATGAIPSPEEWIARPFEQQMPRVRWMIQRALDLQAKLGRPLRILEIGCFDGIVGIPLMRAIGEWRAEYVGVDIQQSALDRFKERAPRWGLDSEALVFVCADPTTSGGQRKIEGPIQGGGFDLVILGEIIEHVSDPEDLLFWASDRVGRDGRLLVTTPHGSYDKGDVTEKRDPRGHVRAVMPRDLYEMAPSAACRVSDLRTFLVHPGGLGAELCAEFEPVKGVVPGSDADVPNVSTVVPAALWDWNASHVLGTGIGASEETIVFLNRYLAGEQPWRRFNVYGPIPHNETLLDEEVESGVGYWPHAQRHLIDEDELVIVSRAPSYGPRVLDQILPGKKRRMILWLQDAFYPDLTPEVAARYERIVVLTEWHRQAMHERHGVPLEKMSIAPNFLLAEHFAPPVEREPFHFIYASSPDRGLLTLLKMWPAIKNAWPQATLDIFYGWEGCRKLALQNPDWARSYRAMRREYEHLVRQPGVCDRGRVNHAQIALEMKRAAAWAHPSEFEETFCSTSIKARAAGCVPVTHPIAALSQTAGEDPVSVMLPRYDPSGIDAPNYDAFELYEHRFLEGIEKALKVSAEDRKAMSERAIAKYRIEEVAKLWKEWLR